MCELTFSDLGKLNKTYFVHQAIINALANNNDGIGYMQDGKFWKSNLSGAFMRDLGMLARDNLDDASPLAFHTRYATNKALNKDCHSHPFGGEKLIVMHNGKLEKKDSTVLDKDKVDSEIFTEELEAEIETSPDIPMVDLLQKVMAEWCGKFAFMIYDLRDSNYYIIRGTTADLHWTHVNDKLIVNTQKFDLKKGTHVLRQLHQLTYGEDLELKEIEALKVNSIYKFIPEDSDLELVGELEESRAPLIATTRYVDDSRYSRYYPATPVQTLGQITFDTAEYHGKIRRWLDYHGMSLVELNELSNVIMGSSLLELCDEDLTCLYNNVLRPLDGKTHVDGLKHWKEIVRQGYSDWAYRQTNFSFPWMLNTNLGVADMLNLVDLEVEEKKKAKANKAKMT